MESNGLDETSISTIRALTRSDRLDYQVRLSFPWVPVLITPLSFFQLIGAIVRHITSTAPKVGGILIFLSGVQEIRQCIDAVRASLGGTQAEVLPLHANLTNDEQRKVFMKTSKWKIIATTNVAEVCKATLLVGLVLHTCFYRHQLP